MKQILFSLIFIVSTTLLAEPQQQTLISQLQHDFESGAISRAEFVAYQLLAIRHSPELPSRYQGLPIESQRHATGLVAEAVSLLPTLGEPQQKLLKSALSRPRDLPLSRVSPSGRFRLHYTDTGFDAAEESFLLESAKAYDDAYELIVNQLGYPEPPLDPVDGPEWDVYISNIGNYGYSTPETAIPTENFPYGATSYIQMDNDFTSTYTKGFDGMRVTAAHEFFHTVQLGIRNFPTTTLDSRWLFEATATWMEDVAYDEVNDYLQYLPHYFSTLDRPFYTFNGLHEYGLSVFFHMMEEKHGHEVIRHVWREFAQTEHFEALDTALRAAGSSFELELTDHMVWNYFTGVRAQPNRYYSEAADYPLVEATNNITVETSTGISDKTPLLSAQYIEIQPEEFGFLSITPEMPFPELWMYNVISQPLGLDAQVFTSSGSQSVIAPDTSPTHSIVLIPVCTKLPTVDATNVTEEFGFMLSLGQISAFEPEIKAVFPNPFRPQEQAQELRIDVRLTEKTQDMTLIILNENGQNVYSEFIPFAAEKYGDLTVYWDGTSSSGEPVSSGIYVIYIKAGQDIKPAKVAVIR